MDSWKRNQSHYQSQLEMLNPQRTLERGYAVIMSKNEEALHAVRKPSELKAENTFQVQLAEGSAEVRFTEIKMTPYNS
jgi:exodeoxyribonuclease VII large subunit